MQGGSPGFNSQRVHSRDAPTNRVPYKEDGDTVNPEPNRCTSPRKRGWEGSNASRSHGKRDEIVCTCNPGVHWTRSSSHIQQCAHILLIRPVVSNDAVRSNWLLYWLVNGSAREPKTDVPSCDKLREAAWRRRTEDLRMGIPQQLLRAMGNAPN